MATINDAVALKSLQDAIDKLNGVEAYVPAEMPDEPLVGAKTMLIPISLVKAVFTDDARRIGVTNNLESSHVILVAAVNYDALLAIQHPFALEVSILRALILSRSLSIKEFANVAGLAENDYVTALFCKRAEMRIVADPADIEIDGGNKLTKLPIRYRPILDALVNPTSSDYPKMVGLLPIFAAIEFQKTNHHYIDNDFYKESYRRHFKSAQLEALNAKFNKALVIYDAVHWLGPMNMEHWKNNLVSDKRGLVSRGILLKITPAPAGTALCKTQLAIWRAISVYPGTAGLMDMYSAQLKTMNDLSEDIDKDRLSYHVFASLYNKNSELETKVTRDRMIACAQMAAVAQAFITTVAQGTDMARAQALRKHAEANVALFKMAQAAFNGTLRRATREAATKSVSETLVPLASARPPAQLALLPGQVEEIQ
jgi:hypothetical protein